MFSDEKRRHIVARARAAIDTAQVLGADARVLRWGGIAAADGAGAPRGGAPQATGTMKADNGAQILAARALLGDPVSGDGKGVQIATHQRACDLAKALSTSGADR